MKKILLVLGIIFVLAGSVFCKTSVVCAHNPSALAGSIIVGTVIAFFVINLLTKVIKSNNKVGSFFINISMIIVWLLCCYGTCFLIRLIFF
jgi:hypothetical protein